MRTRRLRTIATLVMLAISCGLIGTLVVHRQFAQDKQTANVSGGSALGDQAGKLVDNFDAEAVAFERKVVKGAPFSATLIIETIQPAADGTTRSHAATSLIYRDEKGRTRRDRFREPTSTQTSTTDQPQFTTINDPVAGFAYQLEHHRSLVRRTILLSPIEPGANEISSIGGSDAALQKSHSSQILPVPAMSDGAQTLQRNPSASSAPKTRRELLGKREIEGVVTEGTRFTFSLPGAADKEQPGAIVIERWESPELQAVVLMKRSDPRYGESVYRLTSIKRGEPAAANFEIPGDYKVIEATGITPPRD